MKLITSPSEMVKDFYASLPLLAKGEVLWLNEEIDDPVFIEYFKTCVSNKQLSLFDVAVLMGRYDPVFKLTATEEKLAVYQSLSVSQELFGELVGVLANLPKYHALYTLQKNALEAVSTVLTSAGNSIKLTLRMSETVPDLLSTFVIPKVTVESIRSYSDINGDTLEMTMSGSSLINHKKASEVYKELSQFRRFNTATATVLYLNALKHLHTLQTSAN